jgi:DNA-binding NarL/FixJ family response regulator
MIKIAIADDQLNNRIMLKDILSRNKQFGLVLEAVDGEDFLQKLKLAPPEKHPEIVLMDLEMPVVDGVAAIATASALYPAIRFVVLTVFDDDDRVFKAIKAGACGYLLKEESGDLLAELIVNLSEGGVGPVSPSIAYKILQMMQNPQRNVAAKPEADFFQLSDREMQILQLQSEGYEYREIGAKIFLSPHTVKKHTKNIYQKLHVNSKAQALRIAYTKGLL